MTSLPQECNIAIYTVCIAIEFRRPIRFKICFIAGCGHAITCKRSHSDQSEPSFAWPCRHICACAVEREPRIQPNFTRPFSSFWGWGLGLCRQWRILRNIALRPKGEILRHARRFVHNGDINFYARYFGAYLPLCLNMIITL